MLIFQQGVSSEPTFPILEDTPPAKSQQSIDHSFIKPGSYNNPSTSKDTGASQVSKRPTEPDVEQQDDSKGDNQ